MARVPVVSRTVKLTKVNVLCLNLVIPEPFNKEIILPRFFKDEKKLMAAVEKRINSDEVKAVRIVDVAQEEQLLGMTEDEFIALAHPISR